MPSMESNIILPAEWTNQEFVQLTWPHHHTDWASILDEVDSCFVAIAKEIVKHEQLLIVCENQQRVANLLKTVDVSKISYVEIPTNDTWARDHGGISIFDNGKNVVCDFRFNGWGNKFDADLDNSITRKLVELGVLGDVDYKNCLDFVLEGGSIESDGEGTLLTTSQCLLSKHRNSGSKEEIELRLKNYFGLKQILWISHGYLAGDDTDSHIDTLARFCSVDTITYITCEDENDEHFDELQKMELELKQCRRLNGQPYKLIALPMADPVYEDNMRLPATYANFLIINNAVLMPTYNSPKDEIAKYQLQLAFPTREIIGVDCRILIRQHGSLHCVTMQYPSKP
jgi:agmatine deiminase